MKAGFAIDRISRLPDSMDTVSDVANANVSQNERENSKAHSFKTGISQTKGKSNTQNTTQYAEYVMFYPIPPPARSLCTIIGPGGI